MKFITHYSSSSGNFYEVHGHSEKIILEAGVDPASIKKSLIHAPWEYSGVLLSHSHGDHIKSAHRLQKYGLYLYMTKETEDAIRKKIWHTFVKQIEPYKLFKIGQLLIKALPTKHDCPGSVCFLIQDGRERLLFATDTYYIPYKIDNITIAAIECNWSEKTKPENISPHIEKRLYKSHMSLERVLEFFDAQDTTKLREVHLLHLSDNNSDADYFKQEVQKKTGVVVKIAKRGNA